MRDDRNEPPQAYDLMPIVPPGALQEHLTTPGVVDVLNKMPVGERRIYARCSPFTVRQNSCLRIDRVEKGFRIFYGLRRDLQRIHPAFY